MGIHGNGWDFFPWNLKLLAQRAAKYTSALEISIGIGALFVYSRWCIRKDFTRVKFGIRIQTTIQKTQKCETSKKSDLLFS